VTSGAERHGEASPLRGGARSWHCRFVVPYTRLAPEVLWALQEAGVDFEPIDVSGADDAYWELLADLWRSGETFAIIEHDIVVPPNVLNSLDDCDEPWCVAKYRYLRGNYWGLGCTRFAGSLTRAHPDVLDYVATLELSGHPARHWCTLDAGITSALRSRLRAWPHVHGVVEHLGDGLPTHGCRQ
jgi:hypothetical protein